MIMKLLLCAVAAHALQGSQLRRTRTILKATRTEQILQHLEGEGDGLGAGAAGTLKGLRALDARWDHAATDRSATLKAFCDGGVGGGGAGV